MARDRIRDFTKTERLHNESRVQGSPGAGGRARIGGAGRSGGVRGQQAVTPPPGRGVNIQHVTLLATASQTIASGGAPLGFDRIAGAPTEVRGFPTLLGNLTASGEVFAIHCDLTGHLLLVFELQFQDATTGDPLDTDGVDCTITIERLRDSYTASWPELLEDTDLIGITGPTWGNVDNGDEVQITIDPGEDIKVSGTVQATIIGVASPTSRGGWQKVFDGDVWGLVYADGHWWTTEGTTQMVRKRDDHWAEVDSFTAPTVGVGSNSVRGITYLDGYLWVLGSGDELFQIDPSDYSTASSFSVLPDNSHNGCATDGTDLWEVENDSDELRRWTTAGSLQQTISLPTSGHAGLAYHSGLLYVVDSTSAAIKVYETDGTLRDTIDVSDATSSPTGVFVAAGGAVYVSEDGVGVWRRRSG